MFEKTQTAVTELVDAVSQDATQAAVIAKAAIVPAVAGFFGNLATHLNAVKDGIEDGSLFTPKPAEAPEADDREAAPLPTEDQNTAIKGLKALGRTDDEIAAIVGVDVLTVKMGW